MKLLISPKNIEEAKECIKSKVDIIDVKNPLEGSLGANFPWIIRDIRKIVPSSIPISATIGDVSFKPGTISLACLGAIEAGAFFVKVGLYNIHSLSQGIELMKAVKYTVIDFKLTAKIVVAGYAEGETIGSLNPLLIPEIAYKAKCDYAMIDTYKKDDGKTLFDKLPFDNLSNFIMKAKKYTLGVALGGSIFRRHIPLLKQLQPDIIGLRSAVCERNDRMNGKIKAKLIDDFYYELTNEEK